MYFVKIHIYLYLFSLYHINYNRLYPSIYIYNIKKNIANFNQKRSCITSHSYDPKPVNETHAILFIISPINSPLSSYEISFAIYIYIYTELQVFSYQLTNEENLFDVANAEKEPPDKIPPTWSGLMSLYTKGKYEPRTRLDCTAYNGIF